MSFTDEVKHEITRIKDKDFKPQLAELAALIRMNGSIQIINKKLAVKIRLFQNDLARKVYSLIKERFKLRIEIVIRRHKYFANYQYIYNLILPPQKGIRIFLVKLGFLDSNNRIINEIKDDFIDNRDCQKAYLRGAFLGGGYVNTPRGEYHLEFRCEHQSFAEDLIRCLEKFELNSHSNQNRGKYIVYFKKFNEITTILNIIGAHQALFRMENRYLLKEVKNDVNRKVNCETANLDKIVKAALLQIEDIEMIEQNKGFNFLPKKLKEIAILRKDNPYASLKELGQLLNPPLTKSGVNHRLYRIKKIAERIRGED